MNYLNKTSLKEKMIYINLIAGKQEEERGRKARNRWWGRRQEAALFLFCWIPTSQSLASPTSPFSLLLSFWYISLFFICIYFIFICFASFNLQQRHRHLPFLSASLCFLLLQSSILLPVISRQIGVLAFDRTAWWVVWRFPLPTSPEFLPSLDRYDQLGLIRLTFPATDLL